MAEKQRIGGEGGLLAAAEHMSGGNGNARHEDAQHGIVLHQIGARRTGRPEVTRPGGAPGAAAGPGLIGSRSR